jgi:hypothetical protein
VHSCPDNSALAALFFSPFLAVLSWQSYSASNVSACSVLPVQLHLSLSAYPVPACRALNVLLCLSRSGVSALSVLFCVSYSTFPVLSVPFCLSSSACPVCLFCSDCPVLPFLFCLSRRFKRSQKRKRKDFREILGNQLFGENFRKKEIFMKQHFI